MDFGTMESCKIKKKLGFHPLNVINSKQQIVL